MSSANATQMIPPELLPRLRELFRAYEAAHAGGLPVWEFAVELSALYDEGLTPTDLRRLVTTGILRHRRETTSKKTGRRTFVDENRFGFTNRSAFVLTEDGYARLSAEYAKGGQPGDASTLPLFPTPSSPAEPVPHWDAQRGQLWFEGELLYARKRLSPRLEGILAAFEEQHWVARIADPLQQGHTKETPHELRDAVRRLNRALRKPLIGFRCDGTGEGIIWEARKRRAAHKPRLHRA
jgi:hypothetical protein